MSIAKENNTFCEYVNPMGVEECPSLGKNHRPFNFKLHSVEESMPYNVRTSHKQRLYSHKANFFCLLK